MFSLSFFLVNQQDQLLPASLSFNHFHDANNVAYMAIIIVTLISYLSFFSYCFVFLPKGIALVGRLSCPDVVVTTRQEQLSRYPFLLSYILFNNLQPIN